MQEKKRKRPGSGKVAFMARFDAIKAKIDAYHSIAEVYEDYQDVVPIGYGQFRNYVNHYIKGKSTKKKPADTKVEETIKPFLENHESTVKKEDII
jgi:hypothetical protein